MWVVDVDAERAEHLRLPELGAGDPPHLVAAIDDRLALWGYNVHSVPIANPSAPPHILAKRSWIFTPAAHPDRIWVGFRDPENPPSDAGLAELREIDARGKVITRGVRPPHGSWPYAELAGGLLFQGARQVRLWDPDRERTVSTFPRRRIGGMGPVSGGLLASCFRGCKELILTDFATEKQRRIATPKGLACVAPEASFSPDGATLAVPVKEASGDWKSFGSYDRELALVSLETGETEIIPGSTVPPGYVFTAWSSDGQDIFMTGGGFQGGRTTREVLFQHLGETRARVLDIEVGNFYDMATG